MMMFGKSKNPSRDGEKKSEKAGGTSYDHLAKNLTTEQTADLLAMLGLFDFMLRKNLPAGTFKEMALVTVVTTALDLGTENLQQLRAVYDMLHAWEAQHPQSHEEKSA